MLPGSGDLPSDRGARRGNEVKQVPAHAGRLRPLERCIFTMVFALMASFVVLVAFMATTTRGHLLLTGPATTGLPVVAGLNGSTVQDPTAGSGSAQSTETHHASSRRGGKA